MLFGYLGQHFGGLGGSWGQVEIVMDFGTLPWDHPNPEDMVR